MTSRLLMLNLLKAVYWFDEALQEGLKAKGWDGLTRAQSLVVMNVATGVTRATDIARNLGVSRQAMSQTLAEMEARGVLRTYEDAGDRRVRRVNFSAESSGIRDDAVRILADLETRLARRIGADQVSALHMALAADWGPHGDEASDQEQA
ncbi:MarR family winged helix-turn-helix transcriptional regulator [Caulobacter sp. DWP3-1-3b2]|uniref:MarR family winged helix-turn-helix transcriptional regulator n=1 Tax=Caulobacter sp. DWP3-1-3b2 TaxID=2804643 RepID=UPI003CEF424F